MAPAGGVKISIGVLKKKKKEKKKKKKEKDNQYKLKEAMAIAIGLINHTIHDIQYLPCFNHYVGLHVIGQGRWNLLFNSCPVQTKIISVMQENMDFWLETLSFTMGIK